MSGVGGDDGFDDFDFDDSALAHIDAVESKLIRTTSSQQPCLGKAPVPAYKETAAAPSLSTGIGDTAAGSIDLDGEFDAIEYEDELWDSPTLESLQSRQYGQDSGPSVEKKKHIPPVQSNANQPRPFQRTISGNATAGPSRLPAQQSSSRPLARSSSASYVQRDLFGHVVAHPAGPGLLVMSSQANSGRASGTKASRQTKQWGDSAARDRKAKAVSKSARLSPSVGSSGRRSDEWQAEAIEDWDSEEIFGQSTSIPPPLRPPAPLPSDEMKLQLDLQAARKFIYPTNMAQRDYQFNIVQRALYDNVLVALPTGLGKTFIAAVVILNFFYWYPKGKIVFVAPTRPLVAQQQVACHGICGLPWDVACEMTGNTSKSRRGDEWEEKRIFYMTPQTLDNDLRTGDVDPRDIVCLVVDEAHRATGNYAYCNIVSQVQAVNPYFRILALTATPGSNAERVQEVIDNLHISLIELRTEEALDIRQYIHKKHEETMVVAMTEELSHIRDKFLDAMRENCEALVKHGLLPNADPATLHPFRVRSVYRERQDVLAKKRWLGATIQETANLAEARNRLDIFSIRMFRNRLSEFVDGLKRQDKKNATYAAILNMACSIPHQAHPKMVAAVDTVLEHFRRREAAGDASSRVMIFCSLRECVHEIVELLNAHEGLKATEFIGQAADKQGRGMTQKQQQGVIEQFKKGHFNVIVATSIGEEGLDIGEVDLIICYEAVKDSVRMLQRVGRTGRKRDGRIVVLMSDGPESSVWQKSKDTYKGVQQTIVSGHSVTLFDDVPRLIPSSIKPVPTFEELDQPHFKPEMIGTKKGAVKSQKALDKAKKRKERHSDVNRNVPEGALLGFLKASNLGRSKNSLREGDDEPQTSDVAVISSDEPDKGVSDDSDDEALARGVILSDPNRRRRFIDSTEDDDSINGARLDGAMLASKGRPLGSQVGLLGNAKRSAVPSIESVGKSNGGRLGARAVSLQKKSRAGLTVDEEVDEEVLAAAGPSRSLQRSARPKEATRRPVTTNPAQPITQQSGRGSSSHKKSPVKSGRSCADDESIFGLSFDLDTETFDREVSAAKKKSKKAGALAIESSPESDRDASPDVLRRGAAHPLVAQLLQQSQAGEFASSVASATALREKTNDPVATRSNDQRPIEDSFTALPLAGKDARQPLRLSSSPRPIAISSPGDSQDSPVVTARRKISRQAVPLSSQDQVEGKDGLMGPPAVPNGRKRAILKRSVAPITPETPEAGPSTVRSKGGKGKRSVRSEDESEPSASPGPSKGKKQRDGPKAVKKAKRPPKKLIGGSPTSRAFFQFEAERDSDDDRPPRANRSDSDDDGPATDEADSSDLEHVGDFQPTQAPRGYDQVSQDVGSDDIGM